MCSCRVIGWFVRRFFILLLYRSRVFISFAKTILTVILLFFKTKSLDIVLI